MGQLEHKPSHPHGLHELTSSEKRERVGRVVTRAGLERGGATPPRLLKDDLQQLRPQTTAYMARADDDIEPEFLLLHYPEGSVADNFCC